MAAAVCPCNSTYYWFGFYAGAELVFTLSFGVRPVASPACLATLFANVVTGCGSQLVFFGESGVVTWLVTPRLSELLSFFHLHDEFLVNLGALTNCRKHLRRPAICCC